MTCWPGLPLQLTRSGRTKAFADPGVWSASNLNFISTCICIYTEFCVSSDGNPRCPWRCLVFWTRSLRGLRVGLGAREKKQQLEEALPGPTEYLDESLHSRCQVPCYPVGPRALPSPPLPHSLSVPHKNKGPA